MKEQTMVAMGSTRRFEIGPAKQYWQITSEDAVVRLLFGSKKKGSERGFTREFNSVADADAFVAHEIRLKIADGWTEVTPTSPQMVSTPLSAFELERAMVSRTLWIRTDFIRRTTDVPNVVFGIRNARGKRFAPETENWAKTFRSWSPDVFEDVHGIAVDISPSDKIGVVHRLDLDGETLASWRNEIGASQPFDQLEREHRLLWPNERQQTYLYRWMSAPLPLRAMKVLDERGWAKDPFSRDRYKPIDANLRFKLGIGANEVIDMKVVDKRGFPKNIQFGTLDPVAISEMLFDIETAGVKATWKNPSPSD